MATAKPKKDRELLTRLHSNLGTALDRTIQRIVDTKEDIPAALASAAGAFLKLHGVEDELDREQRNADAQEPYVPPTIEAVGYEDRISHLLPPLEDETSN